MRKAAILIFTGCFFSIQLFAQASIYKTGWTDFNKNGKMDVFEDAKQPVEKRIANLLFQMTLNEKTVGSSPKDIRVKKKFIITE